MALKEPQSVDECVYFTRRTLGNGEAMAWVLRGMCPKCGKGQMAKPFNAKTGKFKTRAKVYVCPSCAYEVPAGEYTTTLECNIRYTCPHCRASGETRIPYQRVRYQGAPSLVFECAKCRQKIVIADLRKAKGEAAKAE